MGIINRSRIFIYLGALIVIATSSFHLIEINVGEFLNGFLLGVGLGLVFLGIYLRKHSLDNIKNFKKSLVNKFKRSK